MEKQYLYSAIKYGDIVRVKSFFESSTNKEISSAIFDNVEGGNGILQYILKLHQNNKRPVNIEIFGEVLRHCSDDVINTKDANGEYPLLMAARTGEDFLCQFQNIHLTRKTKLLKKVNWKVTDNQGRGVLANAILSGDSECCNLVLNLPDALYHIRARENDNSNVLHCLFNSYAAKPEQKAVFNFVLNKLKLLYANVESLESSTVFSLSKLLAERNKLGETPLHLLAKSRLIDNLRDDIDFEDILKSSNLLARTKNNETVIDLAVKHNNSVIVDFVLRSSIRHFEELRDKKNLVQKQKLQQQEKQSAQLVIQQEKLLDLEQKEEIRRDELYSRLQAACLGEELKIRRLLQSEVESDEATLKISAISEAKSKLALEKVAEERIRLQQKIEKLEAEISNDRKVQEERELKVRCQFDDITTIRSHVEEAAELQRKVKCVRQEINETVKNAELPLLDAVGVLTLQIKYQELLKLENSQRKVEELLFKKIESQESIRKEVHSQVEKELQIIQKDLQRNRQECLKFIAEVLEGLQQEYPQRRMYVEGLEELEEEQNQLIEVEKKLTRDRRNLKIKSVLMEQLSLQNEVLNEIRVSQNPQQESQQKKVALLNERLKCINTLVGITKSILDTKDRIAEIERLQVELDQVKEQKVVSGSAGLRLWTAKHIALLNMKMRLQEGFVQQIQKGEEVVKESNRQAILGGIQVPLLKMLPQELVLEERIQSMQCQLLKLRKLSLETLDKQLSDDSLKQLGKQLEQQLKNLDKLKKDRDRIRRDIKDIQRSRSQKEGGSVSETHMLQEEKKYVEKEYEQVEKTIAILQKEIVEKRKDGIQEILQELKCALFKNLDDRNFVILSEYREIFGDYSSDDSELVSSIIKGYERFNDVKQCRKYYEKVNDLDVDIGKIRHVIESRDIELIQYMFHKHKRLSDQNALIKEVIKVKDSNFLHDVVSVLGISTVLDCMIDCSEKEGPLDYMSPEAFINIIHSPYITSDDYQKLAKIFAANGNLFDTVIREASSDYLIVDGIKNIVSADRGNFPYAATIMSKVRSFLFFCVNNDRTENLKLLLRCFPYMVYDIENGKSLLETASDLQNIPLVKYIISVHRKMVRQAVEDEDHYAIVSYHSNLNIMQSFDQVSRINSEDVLSILKENNEFIKALSPSARDLLILKVLDNAQECGNVKVLQYCAEVYPELISKDLGYNLARIYDTKLNSATISATPLTKEESALKDIFPLSRGNVGQFGILSQYMSVIRSGNIERFQKEIIDLFNNNVAKYAEKSHGEIGHTIFTLVAAFGNVEQWNKLVKGYQDIKQNRKTKNIFADISDPLNGNRLSTLLSPLQAAVIKCNMQMIKYFIENITPKELAAVYGDNGDNVFHTMISEDQFNLVEDIVHSGKFPADALMKAFLQPNKKGVTPFAIAAEKGYKRVCIGFIHEIEQHRKHAKDLMMNEVFVKDIVDSKDLDLLEELFNIKCYIGKSIYKQRIHLTKHKIAGHNLLTYACKVGNEEFIKALMKYYNERDLFDVLQEVVKPQLNIKFDILHLFLSDLISRSTDPEILNKVSRCVVHNANALAAFDALENTSSLSISQKLSIRDIIEQNNSQSLRYLIEKTGEDFWLKCDEGLSCLGLAVCYPDMLEICCDYLKNNPEVALGNDVLPHSAILSNNLELLEELIKRNPALLLEQYDVRTPVYKKIAKQLKQNYKCNFKSFETLYDFARRENADPKIIDYLELASLNYCNSTVDLTNGPVVNESLVRMVAKRTSDVATLYPELYNYTIDQFSIGETIRSVNHLESNIFHLVTKENVKFLYAIAERSYKHAIDVRDENLQNLMRNMVNQINPSSGLSFFQYLALSGNYDMYKSIKLLCGDINSKTSQKANLAHLCAYSGMKDEKGNFEFENLIKNDKKLATASDRRGKGLLYYVAEGRVQDLKVREEAFNLILSQKLDGSIEKLSQNKYNREVLNAIFVSESQELSRAFLERIGTKKRSDLIKQQKKLLHIVKNTSDPVKKESLLSYESNFAACAEALFGNRNEIGDSSGVSPAISITQLEAPQDDTAVFPSSQHEGLSSSLADEMANILPESKIVVSKDKKEILDSQNEIESLIQKGGSIREYTGAINRAPSASVLQLRTLSEETSIVERAVLSGNVNFIEALLNSNKKLNPNITDNHGNTLLHKCVDFLKWNPDKLSDKKVQYLFTKLIRNHGFDINCRNECGDTVLDMLQGLEESSVIPLIKILMQDSRVSEHHNQRFSKAKSTFLEYDSTYDVSNEIKASKVLQCKFSDLCYEICSNILGDESVKYKSVADINYARLRKILNDNVIRKTLVNTDANGDNILQKLCRDIAAGKIKNDNIRLLELIETIVRCLKDVDPELLQNLLFDNRNLRFENGIESIAAVPGAYTLVKKIEELLGKRKISDACDFNSMLVNCAEAGNADLYDYIRKNYATIGINNVDIHGSSSLHKAVITGSRETVEAVLSTGSNINRRDKDGNTPLHSLLIFMISSPEMITLDHVKLVEFLVSRGALLSVKNKLGIFPSQIARFIDDSKKISRRFSGEQVDVLQSLMNGRDRYYDIKSQCISKLKNYVQLKQNMKYDDVRFDIMGGILSTNMGGGKLQASKLLNSNFCQEHRLQTVKFNFSDEDRGYVQSVGKKRNYVVTDGSIKLKLSWKPVVPKGAKEQVVNVIVDSDGSISLADKDVEKYGKHGERIHFDRCCIYVGGIKLEDALRDGRWKEQRNKDFLNQEVKSTTSLDEDHDSEVKSTTSLDEDHDSEVKSTTSLDEDHDSEVKSTTSLDEDHDSEVKSTTSLDEDHDSHASIASQPLGACALDKDGHDVGALGPDLQASIASQSLVAFGSQARLDAMEESETLLPHVKSEDMYSPIDQDEVSMKLLVLGLPNTLVLQEEKSRFLDSSMALKKRIEIFQESMNSSFQESMNSSERQKLLERQVKFLCKEFSGTFLEYRKMLYKLSSKAFQRELISQTCNAIFKQYKNNLCILHENLKAVSCLNVPLACEVLLKQTYGDELKKYQDVCKKVCLQVEGIHVVGSSSDLEFSLTTRLTAIASVPKSVHGQYHQLKTVESKDSVAEIREGISDDNLFDKQKGEEHKVKTVEYSQDKSYEKVKVLGDTRKSSSADNIYDTNKTIKNRQKVLMPGLVPRTIDYSKSNEEVSTTKRSLIGTDDEYILKLSKRGWKPMQYSDDAVKNLSDCGIAQKDQEQSQLVPKGAKNKGKDYKENSNIIVKKSASFSDFCDLRLDLAHNKGKTLEDVSLKKEESKGDSTVTVKQELISNASLGSVVPLPSPEVKRKSKIQDR
ncbi:ankyrin repeat domain-containing protein [Ehrlichia japonica]|uniref:Ankyrin repeat family protein n=1 Tax=Ehrlichia japonica TaxID=391036 RepID=X5GJV2_9RICK|nr:ankyrin repeat domain-containing protein [Ehrlichia japonica]AHX04733.1 ankyrin repeat family protein [Ehrlichia japonica]